MPIWPPWRHTKTLYNSRRLLYPIHVLGMFWFVKCMLHRTGKKISVDFTFSIFHCKLQGNNISIIWWLSIIQSFVGDVTVFGVNWLNTRFPTRALPSYMMWRQTDREPFRLCILSDCVKVIESCLGSSTTICRERFLLLNWCCKECI